MLISVGQNQNGSTCSFVRLPILLPRNVKYYIIILFVLIGCGRCGYLRPRGIYNDLVTGVRMRLCRLVYIYKSACITYYYYLAVIRSVIFISAIVQCLTLIECRGIFSENYNEYNSNVERA